MPEEALSASLGDAQSPLKFTDCFGGCGAKVPYRTTSRVYCASCRSAKKKESWRRAAATQRRKHGVQEIKGKTFSCEICGSDFIATSKSRAKFCSECRYEAGLRRSREWSAIRGSDDTRKERFNEWYRDQAKRPEILLSRRMKRLVALSLEGKGGKGGKSWKSLVGYSIDALRRHIELQFLPGMSWENRSEWHLDHIVPLSSFKFSSSDDPEFKAAWAITNLRPLWGRDNVRKNAKRIFLI